MKIDLHVHTSERSGCASLSEAKQIRAAMRAGLDGIAITDHDRLVPSEHLRRLNKEYAPFKIFTGIEVTVEDIHCVVLGLHDRALEHSGWRYPALLSFVHEQGGFVFLAHPFRYRPHPGVDLDAFPPDGIEVESINTPASRKTDIYAIAARFGLVPMRNSDAHHPGGIGKFWNNLQRPADDDQTLVEALFEMKRGPESRSFS